MMSKSKSRWGAVGLLIGAVSALGAFGCGSRVTEDTGTETHWLKACTSDEECGGRLACLCNLCTRECSELNACPSQAPHCVGGEALDCSGDQQIAVCYAESESDLIAKSDDSDSGVSTVPIKLQVPDVDDRRPAPGACDESGWCWESPAAPGERFSAFSADRQFAVGERGTVFSMTEGYLPPPTASDLLAVVTLDEQPWVASSSGIWSYSARGWNRHSEVGASALAVTPTGEVWALRGANVVRLDIETWVDMTPTPAQPEVLMLHDMVANTDGSISVIGSYFQSKTTSRGVLFTWEGKSWREQAAGFDTGDLEFLEGPANPYVYHVPSSGDDSTARVYEPALDWQVIAEREGANLGTVFWGPDGHWWLGSDGAVFSFDEPDNKVPSGITCGVAINWDARTVLCAGEAGGLSFISASKGGTIEASPGVPTFEPYLAETFTSQPTPVWAQTNEAWATSPTDVWRAPLEHYNGRIWQSLLGEGDAFSAQIIDGAASDDVWFASETELRHWDGNAVSTFPLPAAGAPIHILSVRAAEGVWVLMETTSEPFQVLIASDTGEGWVTEYQAETNVTHGYGTIAGGGVDKWATLGHEVLRQQNGVWSVFTELDANEWIMHSASDDDTLWLITDTNVYHVDGGGLSLAGYRPAALQRLALTPGHVWNFGGGYVRKLPR